MLSSPIVFTCRNGACAHQVSPFRGGTGNDSTPSDGLFPLPALALIGVAPAEENALPEGLATQALPKISVTREVGSSQHHHPQADGSPSHEFGSTR